MNTRITIRDIARSLNLSHTTVSRVLNGQGGSFISEATRERVLAAVREMNYQPNRAARALATGRSHILSMWVGDLFHPYFVNVMHHMGEQLDRHRYELMIYRVRNGAPSPSTWTPDGILALDEPALVSDYLDSGSDHPPLVSMGPYYVERTDFVGVDLYAGTEAAVQHLLSQGRRQVAYLVSAFGNHVGDARYDAYTAVMRGYGLPPEYIVSPDNSRALARKVMYAQVERHGHPDGLFCFSDDMALGAYRALCDLGIRVPDDTAMVGCDGIEDTEYLEVPLSTVEIPFSDLCAQAYTFLNRRIEDPALPLQRAVLTPHLVIRASSGAPGSPLPLPHTEEENTSI